MAARSTKPKKTAKVKRAPKKIGRPRVKIDLDELEKLAALQCTQEDVAAWFGIGIATAKRYLGKKGAKHHAAWQRGLGKGRVSLRRKQFKLADKSAAMAIFLGKQYLGQSDKMEYEHSGEVRITEIRRTIVDPKS